MTPDAVRALYRRHEAEVLRRHMARVRSPEVAAELTAETFASALVTPFDPSRDTEAEWLERLADRALATAYRTGVVGGQARERAGVGAVAVDRRGLDRIWRLRGPRMARLGPDRAGRREPRAASARGPTSCSAACASRTGRGAGGPAAARPSPSRRPP